MNVYASTLHITDDAELNAIVNERHHVRNAILQYIENQNESATTIGAPIVRVSNVRAVVEWLRQECDYCDCDRFSDNEHERCIKGALDGNLFFIIIKPIGGAL